jgi:hypothetical protein
MTLTLTRGPVSKATMVSEPGSHLLAVGSGWASNDYLFFILAADADVVPIFFGMKLTSLNY